MSFMFAGRPPRLIPGTDRERRRSRLRRRAAAALAAAPVLIAIVPSGVAVAHGTDPRFTVYSETNALSGNEIVALAELDGTLRQVARYATGGAGTGAGPGSQGAVTASHGFLLAVDAGSNQLSRYCVNDLDRLRRISDLLEAGLNLAGIGMVLDLEAQSTQLRAEQEDQQWRKTASIPATRSRKRTSSTNTRRSTRSR